METSLNPVQPASSSAGSLGSPAQGQADLPRDMFTRLLVAQITNQDPLSPQDPSQYVQQLSQLSQTESLRALSEQQSHAASALQALQTLALGGRVGSAVTVASDTVQLGQDRVNGEFTLGSATTHATLVLTGSDGIARTQSIGAQPAGTTPFAIDPAALGVPPGQYQIAVQTEDRQQVPIGISGLLQQVRVAADGSVQAQVSNVGSVAANTVRAYLGAPATTL